MIKQKDTTEGKKTTAGSKKRVKKIAPLEVPIEVPKQQAPQEVFEAPKEIEEAVDEMAEKLINKLPECTRYAKQQLNFWKEFSWSMTIGHAKDWLTVHTDSAEVREGVRAFVEKKPIDYQKFRKKR